MWKLQPYISENIHLKEVVSHFQMDRHSEINQRRLEYLASLGLDIRGRTVLELGAGIGDHTSFFFQRDCQVVTTDARKENLEILSQRFIDNKAVQVKYLDMNQPDSKALNQIFDIVYCYGLLYHLENPENAIKFISQHCNGLLLLQSVVSLGNEELINSIDEVQEMPTQAVSGKGCRPTRKYIFELLKKYFKYVYMPITQPNHEEYILDWEIPDTDNTFNCSIFIASTKKLSNNLLVDDIPMKQVRCP